MLGLLLLAAGFSRAQTPVITTLVPLANAQGVARNAPITVSFSQPLTGNSAGALKVFSYQRGGLRTRTSPAALRSNTLTFAPTSYPYQPGEKVQYSVTRAAVGTGGTLGAGRVAQFTVATGGSGSGSFTPGADVPVASGADGVALADLDGTGSLDLLMANRYSNTVSLCLNNGSAQFGSRQVVSVGSEPLSLAVGDVDGDGDLDLLTANYGAGTVSVRRNNGSGSFSGTQEVPVSASPTDLAVGDVDADGDLDLVVGGYGLAISIRLNDGTGTFTGTQTLVTGYQHGAIVVGDVDGDGDLDLAATAYGTVNGTYLNRLCVRLNDGQGNFSGTQDVPVASSPNGLVLGDVDADGDLDLLAATASGYLCLRPNNGQGIFTAGLDMLVVTNLMTISLGDVDADGDQDVVMTDFGAPIGNLFVYYNNGQGSFSVGSPGTGGVQGSSMALGDLDGDGDLDVALSRVNSNFATPTAGTRMNVLGLGVRAPQAAPLLLSPNPAPGVATLRGAVPGTTVLVLDAVGRVVLTTTTDTQGVAHLTLPTGFYLVRSGGRSQRLVVE
jgi:hypothetical protein